MTGSNTSFTEDEIMVIKQLEKRISEDEALQQQLKNGAKHAVEATFRQVAEDAFEDLVNDNFKFYKKVSEDGEVSKEFASLADQLKRSRATKETQVNRRVELNLEVKRLEARLAGDLSHL